MASSRTLCCQVASFVFFLMGFGSFLAAFGSPYWMDDSGSNWGLWRMCNAGGCVATVGSGLFSAPFVGAQALMCVALIFGAVSLGAHLAWLGVRGPRSCVIAWSTEVCSGFLTALALICWGSESIRYYGSNVLSWSFWLALGSGAVLILNSGITACSTGCGTELDTEPLIYSSRRPPQLGGQPQVQQYAYNGPQSPHDSSDQTYSDIEYSIGNMNPNARPMAPNIAPHVHKGHPIRY